MRFADLHCDTLMECYLKKQPLNKNPGHIDVEKLKKGQGLLQCFAIFVPTHDTAEKSGVTQTPYEYFLSVYDLFLREMKENSDSMVQVRSVADIRNAEKAGKISALLTVEDSVHLDGKIERVDEMYEKGVRIASFTWNYENSLAYPNSTDGETMKKPLKPFGREAAQRMEELGIIPDVSHLNDGGFYDLADICKKPFVATHSCARSLCSHTRNMTDDMLKVLGNKGGVVGINFFSLFLNAAHPDKTYISDIVNHAVYMADKAGIDAIALGSDFDGISSVLEFTDYSGMPSIADALSKKFTPAEVDKICSKNVMRLLEECL